MENGAHGHPCLNNVGIQEIVGEFPEPLPSTVLVAFLVGTLGLTSAWWVHHTDQTLQDELIKQTTVAVSALGPAQIGRLAGTEKDLESADYVRLTEKLASIRGSLPVPKSGRPARA